MIQIKSQQFLPSSHAGTNTEIQHSVTLKPPLNSLQRKEKKMLSVVFSPQCVTRKHYITYSIRCHFCIYELQNLQRSVEGCETAACLHIKASFSNTDVAKLLFKPSNTYIHTYIIFTAICELHISAYSTVERLCHGC